MQQKEKESPVYNRLRVLYQLQQSGYFCDAVIHCRDQTFNVQRNILSTCSHYFTALFTNDRFASDDKRDVATQSVNHQMSVVKERKRVKDFFIEDVTPEVMTILIR